ncbi:MAG: LacI family DNA-binding transcriptional regulator [Spirochaetes bacterium]|nr:LacI family DNA-binding transcriptional regulator [Spirochaetota bacterium]
MIDKNNKIPAYIQLKTDLMGRIRKGKAGVKLPSINELMREFGVSLATVNRALNTLEQDGLIDRRKGKGIFAANIDRETIHEAADHRGKQTVLFARPAPYPNSYIAEMVHERVEAAVLVEGMHVVTIMLKKETTYEFFFETVKRYPDAAAVFLLPARPLTGSDVKRFASLGFPFIIFEDTGFVTGGSVCAVSPDYFACGKMMAEYLIRHGHRRIGYIGNEPKTPAVIKRIDGIRKACAVAGIPAADLLMTDRRIAHWESSLAAGYTLTGELMTPRHPTGLIYDSTAGALGGIRCLAERGLRVPGDVSVIGESDCPFFEYANPPITALAHDYDAMIAHAFSVMRGTADFHAYTISTHIIERSSVASAVSLSRE